MVYAKGIHSPSIDTHTHTPFILLHLGQFRI